MELKERKVTRELKAILDLLGLLQDLRDLQELQVQLVLHHQILSVLEDTHLK
jgi:hypothetical protein